MFDVIAFLATCMSMYYIQEKILVISSKFTITLRLFIFMWHKIYRNPEWGFNKSLSSMLSCYHVMVAIELLVYLFKWFA